MNKSIYQVGGALSPDSLSYVVREADEELCKALKAGEFCYVLNSRQMGKSSLKVRTMQTLQKEDIACASIDTTLLSTQQVTPEQWYGGWLSNLIKSFGLSAKFNRRTWLRDREGLPPVQWFSDFIEEVLLEEIPQQIVIFIDEIDSTLNFEFKDDFFALIRACYNQRAEKPQYKRLTFALLGVATPWDLIEDKTRTPFNIGRSIELTGFQLEEAMPLAAGLGKKAKNPIAVLQAILDWTGGQPFLTQKVCKLIVTCCPDAVNSFSTITSGGEAEWVENIVLSTIIKNWEVQDELEHLRTIRDRILMNQMRSSRLLRLYQQILEAKKGGLSQPTSFKEDWMELRLTGAIVNQQGQLRVANRIYQKVFDLSWVEEEFANMRPYSEKISKWLASKRQDDSCLLRDEELWKALEHAADKSLSSEDYAFLQESQRLENRQLERRLHEARNKEELANKKLAEAERAKQRAEGLLERIRKMTDLERDGAIAWENFDTGKGEIRALIKAIKVAQALRQWVREDAKVLELPMNWPLQALREILRCIKERNQLRGHDSIVRSVSFSPDGRYIATASSDSTARLWDLKGNHIKSFKGHSDWVSDVSFSPDGEHIATASRDRTVQIWNLKDSSSICSVAHDDCVWSVSFSPCGKYVASASFDKTARLWNLQGCEIAVFKRHSDWLWSVSFSPSGDWIATGSSDGTARLWDLEGREIAVFKGHENAVKSVSFSPDGRYLATASSDRKVRLWDLSSREMIISFSAHDRDLWGMDFSPDGKYIATASSDRTAKLWDLQGIEVTSFLGHEAWLSSLSFSPDGKYVATASSDKTGRLWDISADRLAALKEEETGKNEIGENKTWEPTQQWRLEELEELINQGCDWLGDYFAAHPQEFDKFSICQKSELLRD